MNNEIEGNKIIAEFDGYKFIPAHRLQLNEDFINYKDFWVKIIKGKSHTIYEPPPYHSSWDWLMPVVEKIESIGYSVNILRNDCSIYDHSFKNTGSGWRKSIKENSKIRSTYQAVVEFLKWYKEQKVQVSDTTK